MVNPSLFSSKALGTLNLVDIHPLAVGHVPEGQVITILKERIEAMATKKGGKKVLVSFNRHLER